MNKNFPVWYILSVIIVISFFVLYAVFILPDSKKINDEMDEIDRLVNNNLNREELSIEKTEHHFVMEPLIITSPELPLKKMEKPINIRFKKGN